MVEYIINFFINNVTLIKDFIKKIISFFKKKINTFFNKIPYRIYNKKRYVIFSIEENKKLQTTKNFIKNKLKLSVIKKEYFLYGHKEKFTAYIIQDLSIFVALKVFPQKVQIVSNSNHPLYELKYKKIQGCFFITVDDYNDILDLIDDDYFNKTEIFSVEDKNKYLQDEEDRINKVLNS